MVCLCLSLFQSEFIYIIFTLCSLTYFLKFYSNSVIYPSPRSNASTIYSATTQSNLHILNVYLIKAYQTHNLACTACGHFCCMLYFMGGYFVLLLGAEFSNCCV